MAQIYLSTKLSGFPWCEFLTDKMKAWCLRLNRTLNSQLLTHCFFLFSEILCRCFSVRFSISEMWSARLRSRSLSKLLQGETSSVSSLIVNIFGSNLSEWLSKYLAVFSHIFCKIIIQKVEIQCQKSLIKTLVDSSQYSYKLTKLRSCHRSWTNRFLVKIR